MANATQAEKPPYQQLVIYRFNAPDLILTPVGYGSNQNLIFEAKEWNPAGYLLDVSSGEMDELLKSTYD